MMPRASGRCGIGRLEIDAQCVYRRRASDFCFALLLLGSRGVLLGRQAGLFGSSGRARFNSVAP